MLTQILSNYLFTVLFPSTFLDKMCAFVYNSNCRKPFSHMTKRTMNMKPNQKKHTFAKNLYLHGLIGFFVLSFFYFEALFCAFTGGKFFSLSTLYMFLFCCVYGILVYLLCTISKNKKLNTVLCAVFLGVTAVIFLIEYFVYKFFKVFYDINTITAGAGDVAGEFTGEIFSLVFSLDGIFKILLFFLPMVLYLTIFKYLSPAKRINAKKRCFVAFALVMICFLNFICIKLSPVHSQGYKDFYTFQSAVSNYGLMTALRLDVIYYFSGNSLDTFANVNVDFPQTTPVEQQAQQPEQEIEYGYNQMELNFSGSSSKISEIDAYVQSLAPSKQNKYTGLFKGKNLIFITAEAFTAEVIDKDLTPTLYRLATKGINFTDYYQPASAGTTGGEYQNVFGMMPTSGGKSFKKSAENLNYFTMGSQLDRLGYFGKAYHNNSYTYYDRNKTHINLGYSDGFMGYGNGMEEYVKKRWPQSDLEMIAGTLPEYIDKQPFNIYYMSVSGHSAYTTTGNSMTKKNWEAVQHLPYSDRVKGYYAANLELEYALAHLVSELETKGIADDTVICISTDHFPYGIDENGSLGNMQYLSELYGYNVTNYFERDHSALILWSGCLEKSDPIIVDSPTFSLDILPTLSNLFGTEFDSRLFVGRDVFSDAQALVFNSNYDWKTQYGTYYSSKGEFVPNDPEVVLPENYVSTIKTIVRNKYNYCSMVLDNNYFASLFPQE